jgi:hypothetical protein
LSDYTLDFTVNIKIVDNQDFIEIHLPSSVISDQKEIETNLFSLIGNAKRKIYFSKSPPIEKTMSHKRIYIIDKRA